MPQRRDDDLELAQTLAEVARALVDEDDVEATLKRICQLAAKTVESCQAVGLSVVEDRRITSRSTTDDLPRVVDEIPSRTGEGPCIDAVALVWTGTWTLQLRCPRRGTDDWADRPRARLERRRAEPPCAFFRAASVPEPGGRATASMPSARRPRDLLRDSVRGRWHARWRGHTPRSSSTAFPRSPCEVGRTPSRRRTEAVNLNNVMLGSEDSRRLADFYAGVLGAPNPDWSDDANGWFGFRAGDGSLAIGPHSDVKGRNGQPGRIMLNFSTADVESEFERIKALGAEVVAEPYEPGGGMVMCTFADPDGNYFQLATPWNPESA